MHDSWISLQYHDNVGFFFIIDASYCFFITGFVLFLCGPGFKINWLCIYKIRGAHHAFFNSGLNVLYSFKVNVRMGKGVWAGWTWWNLWSHSTPGRIRGRDHGGDILWMALSGGGLGLCCSWKVSRGVDLVSRLHSEDEIDGLSEHLITYYGPKSYSYFLGRYT